MFFEVLKLKINFPYLDFVLAITDYNEVMGCTWQHVENTDGFHKIPDDFYKSIQILFYVHDNSIEAFTGDKAVEKYKEYEKKYSVDNEDYYETSYSQDNNIVPCDLEYLKKCIEAYGLNADEELAKLKGYN